MGQAAAHTLAATCRVKLSHEPAQPVQLGLYWDDPGGDLSPALAGYQVMLLLPSNYAPPEGAMWDGWACRWNVGIPITVEAEEDDHNTEEVSPFPRSGAGPLPLRAADARSCEDFAFRRWSGGVEYPS